MPRVVEKVVEVPQIVERVVPKIIKEEVIREVERVVQVPVIQDRVMEVEVPKNGKAPKAPNFGNFNLGTS